MQLYDENLLAITLGYIKDYQKSTGKSPSYRTIQRAFPLYFSSVSKVERYLKVLKERGMIEKQENGAILIEEVLAAGETQIVSLIGHCACGQPMFAEENIEATYSVPMDLLGKGNFFMLRAVGSSMRDAGIFDNDIMFVKKQESAEDGQIVIALVDGGDATAKRFFRKTNTIVLHPENDERVDGKLVYEDIIVKNCEILGIVTNVWHDVK